MSSNAVTRHTLRLSPDCVGVSVCDALQPFLDIVLIFGAASHVGFHLRQHDLRQRQEIVTAGRVAGKCLIRPQNMSQCLMIQCVATTRRRVATTLRYGQFLFTFFNYCYSDSCVTVFTVSVFCVPVFVFQCLLCFSVYCVTLLNIS